MARRVLALAALVQLGGVELAAGQDARQEQRQRRDFCEYVETAATVRVRGFSGDVELCSTRCPTGPMCRTMWCHAPDDDASSGNCRCERAADAVCDSLGYTLPEPEPEPDKDTPIGSAERNAHRTAECASVQNATICRSISYCRWAPHSEPHCHNLGHTPKLYWLFIMMLLYLVFAICIARFYKKMRSKKELQFYKAVRNGTVKVDAPEFALAGQATELDLRMSASTAGSAGEGQAHEHELGVGKAAGDIIGDVTSVLGISALTEVGHAMGDRVGHAVSNVEELALGTVDNVEKQVGKVAKKQVKTIGAKLFGDFLSISKKEMAQKLGSDAMIYLMHLKQCGIFFLKASATYMPILIFCYQSAEYENSQGVRGHDWALYSFTVGALQNERDPGAPGTKWSWISAAITFIFSMHSLYFSYSRWKKLEKLKIGSKIATNSKNTVMLKNIPKKITTNAMLERYFADACPGQIEGVRVALNVHGLCINVRQQRQVYRQLNAMRQAQPWLTDANNYGSTKEEARFRALHGDLVVDLHQLEAENARLRQHEPEGAGCAFVTFKCEAHAKSYVGEARLQSGRVAGDCHVSGDVLVALQRAKWEIHMAPVQHDIYWENLATQESEAAVRTVGTNSLLVGLLTLFVISTFATVLFIGVDFMKYIWHLQLVEVGVFGQFAKTVANLKNQFGLFWFYALFGLPPLLLFLALAEAICPLVRYVSKFEHTQTRTEQQSSYLTKCYFYYMVLHLWCGSCGFIFLTMMVEREDRVEVFLTLATMYHLHKFFLETFVYLPLRVLNGVGSFFRPTREIAVADLGDAAEEEDSEFAKAVQHDEYHNAHFDYSRQYGESLALFAMAHVYAIACPPMMFLCGAWFMAKYAVDKYILAKHYSRARISYGRRARMITKYTLSSVVIGQVCAWQLFLIIGRDSEAKFVMLSCAICVIAFVVYINRKFKIPGTQIEVNLVGFVMKHSPLGEIKYTRGINSAMNEFHEADKDDDDDDDDDESTSAKKAAARAAAQQLDARRPDEPIPVLYDVPTLDTLRYAVEVERLWEPGMAIIDNPMGRSGWRGGSNGDNPDGAANGDSRALSHLEKRKLGKERLQQKDSGGSDGDRGPSPTPGQGVTFDQVRYTLSKPDGGMDIFGIET